MYGDSREFNIHKSWNAGERGDEVGVIGICKKINIMESILDKNARSCPNQEE